MTTPGTGYRFAMSDRGGAGEDKGGKVPQAAVLPLVIVTVLVILLIVFFLAT